MPTYITSSIDIPYEPSVETWRLSEGRRSESDRQARGRARGRRRPAEVSWIDTSKYAGADFLIVRVAWTPDSRLRLRGPEPHADVARSQCRLERRRRRRDDASCSAKRASTGSAPKTRRPPTWLSGRIVSLAERPVGLPHLYHYSADGTLLKQVTSGRWEAAHAARRRRDGRLDLFLRHRAQPDRRRRLPDQARRHGFERLSKADGHAHARSSARPSAYYIDTWSDVTTPPQVRLHAATAREVRVLDENRVAALAGYRLSKPEFVQVKTRDGFVMEAMMIKPPDFDPSKPYPVYQFTYGGPHTPAGARTPGAARSTCITSCWRRRASSSGSATTGRRAARASNRRGRCTSNFGEVELRDIEDGVSWLKQQPYVDGSRIGIHGWSYGGFMTSYALTHSTSFVMGIAGGTVADWRNYDSVYTERYMGTPQDNPEGYRNSSPRFAADDLHGALLLIHGAIDDNVHVRTRCSSPTSCRRRRSRSADAVSEVAPRRDRSGARQAHVGTMFDFTIEHLKPSEPVRSR